MFLIEEILKCRSLSIVGLEKNTGKTECLNYVLRSIQDSGKRIALTSIGLDGESRDQLYQTRKPEITVFEGMWLVTSEKHYREKGLTAEITEVSEQHTALGRLVTARALNTGKIMLSGPPDTKGMKELILRLQERGIELVIVDGALSRMSLGAPTVTEAMILATGAAVSGNVNQLVRKTKYIYDLICLPAVEKELTQQAAAVDSGIWAIGADGKLQDLGISSGFLFQKSAKALFRYGGSLYVAGAVGDKLLSFLRQQKQMVELVIRDFTRIFATPEVFYAFLKAGKTIRVVQQPRLLAICVNPQSPDGFVLDSVRLCEALRREMEVPVVDVRKIKEDDAV